MKPQTVSDLENEETKKRYNKAEYSDMIKIFSTSTKTKKLQIDK